MIFDGSQDLARDADLIAGGLLVEFKASRGGRPGVAGASACVGRTVDDGILITIFVG